jgi:L-asparagine transporter-like permease
MIVKEPVARLAFSHTSPSHGCFTGFFLSGWNYWVLRMCWWGCPELAVGKYTAALLGGQRYRLGVGGGVLAIILINPRAALGPSVGLELWFTLIKGGGDHPA